MPLVNGLPFCKKIVDDILIWAKDENELINNCRTILNRCRELNVSISEKKLEISHSISFAGHIVSNKGITPDPNLTIAIKDFPQPTNISELRSFMGLANQLASFLPDLAQNTSKIRKLLSPKNAFLWLPEHETEFQTTKQILCGKMIVKPFDQNLKTYLITDASRLHGLGFALLQLEQNNTFRLIQCGSKSLNDTQRNYATIELECLAINHAIKKCKFYLHGKDNFTVITDHKPLLGIFNKNLDDLDNPRLQRMREKVMGFNFDIEWIAGKSNLIADTLSRNPKFTNNTNETCSLSHCCIIEKQFIPFNLKIMAENANESYKSLVSSIKNSDKTIPNTNIARQFQKDFHKLSISNEIDNLILINSSKIVIPDNYINQIVSFLHKSHSGYEKTLKLAKNLYYWQTMNNDIKQAINNCDECAKLQPSQQKLTMLESQSYSETAPMDTIGTDLFSHAGKDYLVAVDRFSGYILCSEKLTNTNSANIIKTLNNWFNILGFPKTIRSDGGPQFRSEFDEFCKNNNINHELSSPYNPSSNGLAEQAVKTAKHLLIKCSAENSNFQSALQMWRCVPQKSGFSPAELFFGRRQRSLLPTLQLHHQPIPLSEANDKHAHFRNLMRAAHDKRAKTLPSLAVHQRVLIQHPDTKLWSVKGVINSIRPDGISFVIQLPSGQQVIRGRRLIRPDRSSTLSAGHQSQTPTPDTSNPLPNQPSPPPQLIPTPPPQQPIKQRPKRTIKRPGRFLD